MADGKVIIDVTLDDGRVVKDVANLNNQILGVGKAGKTAALGLKTLLSAIGITALVSKGIDMVKSSLEGAISRYDTLNNFPRVLQLMGFDAKESKKAIDTLSKGIQGLPTTLDSVAKTTQRIALMTGNLDGATKTTLALNDAFLASGASAADAERGLEQYVQMLSTGTVDLESWRTLQETMPIALNKVAEAFGYTGKSAQNDLFNALKKGRITFDQFNKKLIELDGGVGGFAELARKSSGGIGTAFTNMKTAVVRGVTNIIESIDKMLTSNGLPNLQTLISNVGKKFEEVLNGIAKNLPLIVNKIKEVYDTLKPWLPLIASVSSGILSMYLAFQTFQKAKAAIEIVQNAQKALNDTLMKSPWLLVIGAAITAALLIIQYWGTIKDFFINLWNGIKSVAIAVWEPIKSAWSVVVQFFISLWNTVVSSWATVVTTIKAIFAPLVAFFSTIWSNIRTAAQAAWTIIKNVILGPILLLIDLVTGDLKGFMSHLSQIWNNIKKAAQTIWTSLKNVVVSIVKGFVNSVKAVFNGLKSTATAIWNGIKSAASAAWNGIKSVVISIVNGIKNGLSRAWNAIKSMTSSAFKAVVNFIKNPLKSINLYSIGKNIIQGLINGIKSMVGAVGKAIKNVVGGIKKKITGLLGIHSPSRWMRDMIGKNMMLGWQIGIDKEKASTLKKAEQMTEWMKPDIPVVSGFVNRLKGMSAPIGNVMPVSSFTDMKQQISIGSKQHNSLNHKQSIQPPQYAVINIDGRQVMLATIDYYLDEQKRRDSIRSRFRGE
ncbi:phage tail protein [Caenibacillus caldisaponilyticus]|uniref:phage tail protein n=2 Tax=Caenibacillus caldisaponilyticus TaxID=1674942 RepID=UPI0009882E6E|nr:tape measure protein [Caenibacillus caldisaponilyticus]